MTLLLPQIAGLGFDYLLVYMRFMVDRLARGHVREEVIVF
jgi:hypothetical protein